MSKTENFQLKVVPEVRNFLRSYMKHSNFDGAEFGSHIQELILKNQSHEHEPDSEGDQLKSAIRYHLNRTADIVERHINTANDIWNDALELKQESEQKISSLNQSHNDDVSGLKEVIDCLKSTLSDQDEKIQTYKKIERSADNERIVLNDRNHELNDKLKKSSAKVHEIETQMDALRSDLSNREKEIDELQMTINKNHEALSNLKSETEKNEISARLQCEQQLNNALKSANDAYESKLSKQSDTHKSELNRIQALHEEKLKKALKREQEHYERQINELKHQLDSSNATIKSLIEKLRYTQAQVVANSSDDLN